MDHEKYIKRCYELAVRAGKKGFDTFGAVLVHNGQILEEAENTADWNKGIFRTGGEAAGFAQCQLRHDYVEGTETSPVGYLEGIYVREADRGKGIARRLLRACENWAKEQGCTEFASDCELTNIEGQGFHRAVGFEEANRIVAYVRKI